MITLELEALSSQCRLERFPDFRRELGQKFLAWFIVRLLLNIYIHLYTEGSNMPIYNYVSIK